MRTTMAEAREREVLAELARASVRSLKAVFTSPPAGKSWKEIEAELSRGRNLKVICGLSDEVMENAYGEAKEKLGRGDYEGARETFASLCLYDQLTPKYWGGLAKSCERLKFYDEAAGCYGMMALVTNGTEPLPYIGIGWCRLAAGRRFEAIEPLETGLEVADRDSSAAELIDDLLSICRS